MKLSSIVLFLAGATGVFAQVLWDTSLKGIVLLALVLVLIVAMRGHSAARRHLLLVSAMVSLLLIPLCSTLLPPLRILPAMEVKTAAAAPERPVREAPGTLSSSIMESPEDPGAALSAPPLDLLDAQVAPHFTPKVDPTDSVALAGVDAQAGVAELPWSLPHLFLALWIGGTLVCIMRLLLSRLRLCVVEDSARPVEEGPLLDAVRALEERMGIKEGVRVVLGAADTMPMTWGLCRSNLLLPEECETWSRSKFESVVLHELAHIKRRDVATQLIVQVLCALFWFNPLVWIVAWRIRVERERACDDLVLGAGIGAPEYAESLLAVVTGCVALPSLRATAIAMADRAKIEGRVESILNEGINRRPVTKKGIILAFLGFLLAIAPLAMLDAQEGTDEAAESSGANTGTSEGTSFVVKIEPLAGAGVTQDQRRQAIDVIQRRLEPYGPEHLAITTVGGDGMAVLLLGVTDDRDVADVRALIEQTGKLEFRLVKPGSNPFTTDDGEGKAGEPTDPAWVERRLSGSDDGEHEFLMVEDPVGLDGQHVEKATAVQDAAGWSVSIRLDSEGGEKMKALTGTATLGSDRLAILVDDEIVASPKIQDVIRTQITLSGAFTESEANRLAQSFESPLPVRLTVTSTGRVSPPSESKADSIPVPDAQDSIFVEPAPEDVRPLDTDLAGTDPIGENAPQSRNRIRNSSRNSSRNRNPFEGRSSAAVENHPETPTIDVQDLFDVPSDSGVDEVSLQFTDDAIEATLLTKSIQLRQIDAEEAAEYLRSFPGIGGKGHSVLADARTNRLVVRGTGLFLEQVGALAKLLDGNSSGWRVPGRPFTAPVTVEKAISGIGVVLRQDNGRLFIHSVLRESPAEAAGLRSGDRILAVAGGLKAPLESVDNLSLQQIIEKVRGKTGSRIRIQISPQNAASIRQELILERQSLRLQGKNTYIPKEAPGIDSFGASEPTPSLFNEAIPDPPIDEPVPSETPGPDDSATPEFDDLDDLPEPDHFSEPGDLFPQPSPDEDHTFLQPLPSATEPGLPKPGGLAR